MLSAIKAVLKEDKIRINEDSYLIKSLTNACRLRNDQVRTRLPIQRDMLSLLLREVVKYFMQRNQPFLAILYSALFSTMYFGLLRISEVSLDIQFLRGTFTLVLTKESSCLYCTLLRLTGRITNHR